MLYIGCYNNDIPVKLWSKEGIKTSLEAQIEAKTRGINLITYLNISEAFPLIMK